ncbi:MAG: sterol desaturase family protein [Deltaproteobacteria bacterium]|nr:sterol desaturase family protein [Deltaproteobacteria bacterium]
MSELELVTWIAAGVMFGAFTIEALISYFVLRDDRYGLADTFTSIGITIGYVVARLGVGAFVAVMLLMIYEVTPLRWSMTSWWHWVVLFFVNDFFYYWSHRASHAFPFMWASHAVHHNSARMNLSTGLRNSWVGGAIDWVFFVPAILLGFHPLALGAVIAFGSAWDFLTHTPYVGKLRWFDAWANSPSNHRVHHAKNPQYLDKNLGGALIIWDRLFGTYEPEGEKPIYGIDPMPARPNNPFYLELYLWAEWLRGVFKRKSSA